MKINEVLPIENIELSLTAVNKKDLLIKMCEIARRSGKINNLDVVKKQVIEREEFMTTGIGNGIAIPHSKTNAVDGSVAAFAILKDPINYNSVDGEPVKYVYLLLDRENNIGNHLRLLSKISRILNTKNYIEELNKYNTKNEIFDFFTRVEEIE